MLFPFIFYLCIENRLLASNKHLVCMFLKGEEAQGWLATPEWVWCQGTETVTNWQAENKACRCVQEEAWWAGWLHTAALCQGGSWPSLSYYFGESLLSGGFRCQQDVFALSLLADKGASKWDSAAPEVNFSWRSYMKVVGGIIGSGRKMVIAAFILVVEQTCASLLAPMGLVTEVWVMYQEWCCHESRKMLLEICWVPCGLLDGEVVRWCPVVPLSRLCLNS